MVVTGGVPSLPGGGRNPRSPLGLLDAVGRAPLLVLVGQGTPRSRSSSFGHPREEGRVPQSGGTWWGRAPSLLAMGRPLSGWAAPHPPCSVSGSCSVSTRSGCASQEEAVPHPGLPSPAPSRGSCVGHGHLAGGGRACHLLVTATAPAVCVLPSWLVAPDTGLHPRVPRWACGVLLPSHFICSSSLARLVCQSPVPGSVCFELAPAA